MHRDDWLLEFCEELQRLRPHLSLKLAMTIALSELAVLVEPKKAARAYHAKHPVKPARKGK